MLKELEDSSDAEEESQDELDKMIANLEWVEWWAEAWILLKQLQAETQSQKAIIEKLSEWVKKLNSEKRALSEKNAELELYGWGIDDQQVIYINSNLTKARWWDDKAKSRIVDILDSIRSELTGSTKEEEDIKTKEDKISQYGMVNDTLTDPSKKIEKDDFQINL